MFLSYRDEDPYEDLFRRSVMGRPSGDGALLNKFISYTAIKRAETYIKKDYTTSDKEKLYMKLFDEDGNLIGYSTVEQFDFAREEVLQVIPAPPGWWVISPDLSDGFGAAPLIGWRNSTPVFAGPRTDHFAEDIAVLVDPDGHIFSYKSGQMIDSLPGNFPQIHGNEMVVLPDVVRKAIARVQKNME